MNKTQMVHLRMQTNMIEQIDQIAKIQGESRSTVIRGAIHNFLDSVYPSVVKKLEGGNE